MGVAARLELHRAEQAEVPAVDHVRQALERVHAVLEVAGKHGSFVEQAFFFVRIESRNPRRAGERMPGIGVTVEELDARALGAHESVVDRVLHDHATERHRARGDALGEGDQVGLDAKVLRGERRAEPAPAGDHLVEHQQDAVLRADVAQPREIALRRHQHPARGRDRVDHHRGDVGGVVQRDDALLELVRELGTVGGLPF